jgi:hypothetical protein
MRLASAPIRPSSEASVGFGATKAQAAFVGRGDAESNEAELLIEGKRSWLRFAKRRFRAHSSSTLTDAYWRGNCFPFASTLMTFEMVDCQVEASLVSSLRAKESVECLRS